MTAQEIKTNHYISLAEAAEKYTNYSQEYLSLRARQGKLKAVKIGRNWLTKKEWVEEYLAVFNGNGEANVRALSDTGLSNGLRQKKSTAAGPKLFSLGEMEKYSGYSQEYLSLRARQGKLKAVKIGRNWLVAKEWVDEYKNNINGSYSVFEAVREKTSHNLQSAFSLTGQLLKKQSAVLAAAVLLIFCSAGLALGSPYIDNLRQAVKKAAFENYNVILVSRAERALSGAKGLIESPKEILRPVGLRMTEARDEANVAGNEFVSFLGEQEFTLRIILQSEFQSLSHLANNFFQKEKQLAYTDLADTILATEDIENYIEEKVKENNISRQQIVAGLAIIQKEFKDRVNWFFDSSSQMAVNEGHSWLGLFNDKNYQVASFLKQAPVSGKLFKQSFFVLQNVVEFELNNRQHELSKIFQKFKRIAANEVRNQLGLFNDKNRLVGQVLVFGEQEVNELFNQAAVNYLNGQEELLMALMVRTEQLSAAGRNAITLIDGWQAGLESKAEDYRKTSRDNWQYNWRAIATQVNTYGDKLANNIDNFSANLLGNVQRGTTWLIIESTDNVREFSLTFLQKIKFFTSLTSQSLRATSQIAWDSAQISGNVIGDKIVEGIGDAADTLRSLTYSIYNRTSEGLVKGYEFITRPWRQKPVQQMAKTTSPVIQPVESPTIQIIATSTVSTSSAEEMIAQLIPRETIIREIIKQAAPSQAAAGQTIQTIREIIRLDESSLVLIRSQIAELQKNAINAADVNADVKKLLELLAKIQATPPIYSTIAASPAYIGSTGLQASGGVIVNSFGASGLSGVNELSVGGSTTLGKTASDFLTVNASAGFLADVNFSKNVDIAGNLTLNGLVFNTARGGPVAITSTSSPQLTVAYDGSHYFTVVVASTSSSTLASTGALNLTGNGASVWQTISSPLTIKTDTTGDILLSSASNLTEKFATSSAYALYQGETARLAINTAGNISLVASSTIGLTGDTTITGNTTIAGNSTTTGNAVILGNLMVSGTSTLTVTSASQLVVAGNTYFSALATGSVPFIGAGGLLSQDNSNLFWDSATARLGVGTTSPLAKLTVQGDTYIRGDATTTGSLFVGGSSVVFGTSSSSNLIVNSAVAGNLIPDQNAVRDLGSAAYFWDDLYIDNVVANSLSVASTSIGGTNSNDFVINADNATADTETENLIFFRGTVVPNALLTWDATADRFDFNQPVFMQNDSSTTTVVSLDVRGKAGQTADLFRAASSSEESLFNITSNGLVGIGTSTPATKLDVWGNFQVGTSTTPTLTPLFIANTGSATVGIGTSTPSAKLAITGATGVNALQVSSSTGSAIFHVDEYGNVGLATSSPSAHLAVAGAAGLNALQIASTTGSTDFMVSQYGNIGIGTSTPATKLDVWGNFQVGTSTTPTLTPLFIANTGSATVGIGTSTPSAQFSLAGRAGVNTLAIASSTGSSMLALDQYGNLGVGKASPSRKVEILDATNPQLRLTQASGSKYSEFQTNSLGDLIIASNLGQLFKTDSNDYSVAVGQQSGANLADTEAQFNTSLGWQSLYAATSSDYNTAIGFWSLYNNAGGERNAALGANVLYSNVSGSINVGVGDNALYNNTTGGNNTALGANTLLWNQTGEANTVIGSSAGGANFGSVVASSFSSSTIIGMKAGYNLGSGSKNILIGYQAGDSLTTGAKNIIIGYNIDAPAVDSANILNIGNLIYATGLDGDGTTLSAGNVGIGTTTPATKLDIWGNLQVGTSSTPTLYANTGSQHVGIGTSSPATRLSILGIAGESVMHISSSTGSTIFHVDGYGNVGLATSSPDAHLAIAGIVGVNALQIASTTGNTDFMVGQYGNVGIGTSTPSARFDLLSRSAWPAFHIASSSGANMMQIDSNGLFSFGLPDNQTTAMTISEGSNVYLTFDTTDSLEKIVVGKNFEVGTMEVDADSGSVQFVNMNITTTTATSTAEKLSISLDQQSILTVYGEAMGETSGGVQNMRVGIGTSSPIAVLEVRGNASTSGPLLRISTSTTEALYVDATGKIGIGTSSPNTKLSILGVAGTALMHISSSTGPTIFHVDEYGNVGIATSAPSQKLSIVGRAGWDNFGIASSSGASMLILDQYGNFGLGTSTPDAHLAIAGIVGVNALQIASTTGNTDFMVGQYGNVGIGTSTPSARFDLLSRSAWPAFHIASSSGANMMQIDSNGLFSFGLPDNQTTAMTISEGSNAYLTFDTTDSAEKIVIGKNFEVGLMNVDADSGAVNFVNMDISTTTATSTAESLSVSLDGNAILTVYGEAMGISGGVSNWRVGIATTVPVAMLEVRGNASTSGPLLRISTSTTEALYVDALGNVGIGTTSLSAKLTVLDTSSASPRGILSIQVSNDTNGARVGFAKARGTIALPTTVAAGDMLGRLMFRGYDGSNYLEMGSIEVGVSGTVAATQVPTYLAFNTATNVAPSVLTERMRIDNAGNVGIGTTSPATKLDIYGTGTQLRISTTSGYANFYVNNDGYLNIETQYSTTSALQITNSNIVANEPMQFNSPGDVGLSYDLAMENPSAAYIRFSGAGYVQTESPFGNYNLTLLAANAGKVVINDDLQTTGQTNFVATTTQTLTTTSTIQVGGATHIVIDATATIVMISAPTIADGVTGDIIIIRNATSNSITLQDQDTLASSNLQLGSTGRALTNGSTIALMFDGTDWMELWYSGASHADYAEMYKIKEDVSSGEVVSFDKDNYLQVKKAVLGDVDVAGIISAQPAYLIGQEFKDEMQMPVALAGRVPVKISLEAGAIKKGDVLIPATKPGYAMKYNEKYLLDISTSPTSTFQNFDISTSPIPIVGIALEDYSTSSVAGEFLETTYKTYKVKFREGADAAEINRLNGKYKIKNLSANYTTAELSGGWKVIEIRAEYEQKYFQSPLIESSQWLSDNIVRKPNPEFHSADSNNETALCMVKTGYVKAGSASGLSKLTVVEKDGQLAFEPVDKNFADSLDMAIEADGSLVVGKLKAKQAEIGSAEKPAGITLYDEDTGQPYCLKMKAGAMISEAGKCSDPSGNVEISKSQNIEPSPSPLDISTSQNTESSTSSQTSSQPSTSTEPSPSPLDISTSQNAESSTSSQPAPEAPPAE